MLTRADVATLTYEEIAWAVEYADAAVENQVRARAYNDAARVKKNPDATREEWNAAHKVMVDHDTNMSPYYRERQALANYITARAAPKPVLLTNTANTAGAPEETSA